MLPLQFKLKKILGFRDMQEELENHSFIFLLDIAKFFQVSIYQFSFILTLKNYCIATQKMLMQGLNWPNCNNNSAHTQISEPSKLIKAGPSNSTCLTRAYCPYYTVTQPVWTLFLFKSILTRSQRSQGCQKMRLDPLNVPVEVWCAKIAPKLRNI